MSQEKVLVTGGAGYIGSHVVRDLGAAGYFPVVFDNLCTGNRDAVLCGELIVGDLADKAHIREVIQTHRIKHVIHFAAFIVVEESVAFPIKYYRNNFLNSLNLVEACAENGVENFVFSSTAAVYGIPQRLPVTEETPLSPINPYGNSKMFTEHLLKDVSDVVDTFNYVALRYFNVAGADAQNRIGQNYPKATHLITLALRAALDPGSTLRIFGSDYDTPDGTAVRDYIHIDDLSQAHLLSLEFLKTSRRSDIFNCGYGRGYSVLEVINGAKQVTGVDFKTIDSPRREGDPPALIADSRKIRDMLSWKPRSDDLSYIIKTAWEWERKLRRERRLRGE